MFRAGVDTGGTHTDVVVLDSDSGAYFAAKVPTTPAAPTDGIFAGLERACAETGMPLSALSHLVYATTIVVNILAQQEKVRVGLITTDGFRDVLEIGRAYRSGNIYDIQMDRPEPLVPREFRFGVRERIDFRGEVVTPLDQEQVVELAGQIRRSGLRSIAVCLLHAYKNPAHERRIRQILEERCPGIPVSLSSEVNPQFREFERTSTTVINAFVMPAMNRHLADFAAEMTRRGMSAQPFIMQANAGMLSFRMAAHRPVQVTNSGPIAGVVAATDLARRTGYRNLITMDMGGTTCDVSLIADGQPGFTNNSSVRGYPVSIPTVDLHYIGAGGGSIAWVDDGGALRVGPQSAGARPGPACYGLGGDHPTVTDANLLAGRLAADSFLDGSTRLDQARAQEAVERVARRLGLDAMDVAEGIIDIAVSNMTGAVKLVSVERGHDPRDFTLVSFGGAGPLHAALLARELEIPRVVIPPSPGTFSALGTVLADIRYDYVVTDIHVLGNREPAALQAQFAELLQAGARQLDAEGVDADRRVYIAAADLRYVGQGFELQVPISLPLATAGDLAEIRRRFDDQHERTYGHRFPDNEVEMVNLRVTAIGRVPRPDQPRLAPGAGGAVKVGERTLRLWGRRVTCPVIARAALQPGQSVSGPAIVEEMGATALVLPDQEMRVDEVGNLVLTTVGLVAGRPAAAAERWGDADAHQ